MRAAIFETPGLTRKLYYVHLPFGGLTGADVKLNVQSMYSKQIKLIGSTGGTRKEMQSL
jgi:hypothetical protein